MKTRLVLAGKSKPEIAHAIATALDKKELPALEPGAMAYMMSKQQYLNDRGKSWHSACDVFFPRRHDEELGGRCSQLTCHGGE